MRYFFWFFFLSLTKTMLSQRIIHAAFATILIFYLGTFTSVFSGTLSASTSTISLTRIARLTDHHLAVTTQALKETSGGGNRHVKADEGWILSRERVKLIGLCDCTVF